MALLQHSLKNRPLNKRRMANDYDSNAEFWLILGQKFAGSTMAIWSKMEVVIG